MALPLTKSGLPDEKLAAAEFPKYHFVVWFWANKQCVNKKVNNTTKLLGIRIGTIL